MPDSFTVLNEIRKYRRMVGNPLSLTFVHENLKKRFKISSRAVGGILRELHRTGRIEIIDSRINPVGENNRKEVPFTKSDIKDTFLDMGSGTPDESRIFFEDKYGVRVKSEHWNRKVRQMFGDNELNRTGKFPNYVYSLKKEHTQRRLVI